MKYILALIALAPLALHAQGARPSGSSTQDGGGGSGLRQEAPVVTNRTRGDADFPVFGDDSSEFALDGECDDPRFDGVRGPDPVLLSDDRFTDATDCREAFEDGSMRIAEGEYDGTDALPDFGDDSGNYTNDDECDDPRFIGAGMTATTLIEDDVRADATDCREAWERGDLTWRTE